MMDKLNLRDKTLSANKMQLRQQDTKIRGLQQEVKAVYKLQRTLNESMKNQKRLEEIINQNEVQAADGTQENTVKLGTVED